ncbi:MAG: ribosome silencing factor [Chitinispirillales bacterium]|nr:ribosome silencing factor [Chitinispirillales bacterium]
MTVKKAAKKTTGKADKADNAEKAGGGKSGKSVKAKSVLAGKELVDAIVSVLEDKLAERIAVIDLRKVSAAADWFVVCSGDNTSHTTAVANEVIGALKQRHGTAPWHYEGIEEGRWALVDYTDVVVHIMLDDVRKYYNLESLWG